MKGRGKGPTFERMMCVDLSLWVSKGKRRDLFWRAAMSGGRATVFKKRDISLKAQAGDVVAVDPEGHLLTGRFFLELKHYKDLEIDSFLISGTGKLSRFWAKAVRQAKQHDLRAALIAKQNNRPTLLIMETRDRLSLSSALPILMSLDAGYDVYKFDDVLASPFRVPTGQRLLDIANRTRKQ